jgi:hypothetical protein
MALTQLADIIEPQYFSEYFAENSMTSTALFQSGVLVPNALMQEQISMGGHLLNIPAWADLQSPADGGTHPNISNDNPAQTSTPNKLATTGSERMSPMRKLPFDNNRCLGVSWSGQPTRAPDSAHWSALDL